MMEEDCDLVTFDDLKIHDLVSIFEFVKIQRNFLFTENFLNFYLTHEKLHD